MSKLFVGNWKMYLSDAEAVELAKIYADIAGRCSDWDVAAAPSFTALERVAEVLRDSDAELASQDGFWKEEGAYTGEVSMETLKEVNAAFVILGHSEQRKYRGVTDEMVRKQAAAAVIHGLTAIICVGETAEEKEAGKREEVVRNQVRIAIQDVSDPKHVIIAYEPRWAIGSGDPCSPEDAAEMHEMIRSILLEAYGDEGRRVRILYGGSVNPENIQRYADEEQIGGVLVGGASTKGDEVNAMLCGSS